MEEEIRCPAVWWLKRRRRHEPARLRWRDGIPRAVMETGGGPLPGAARAEVDAKAGADGIDRRESAAGPARVVARRSPGPHSPTAPSPWAASAVPLPIDADPPPPVVSTASAGGQQGAMTAGSGTRAVGDCSGGGVGGGPLAPASSPPVATTVASSPVAAASPPDSRLPTGLLPTHRLGC
uniref:OSJNBa0004N05.6 protein n=1 Tax=Oryza sativa subsp. japonica TaxID=39947 RepID=Q7XQ01_ORYSJ|nr:OSJNBa0004N05.6 [Oryza sativa Japonica Group]